MGLLTIYEGRLVATSRQHPAVSHPQVLDENNYKQNTMMITKTLKTKIATCWKNGWYVDNIARIVGTDPDTVRTVLMEKGVSDIK